MGDVIVSHVRVEGLSGRIYASTRPAGDKAHGAPAFVLVHGIGVSHRYLWRLHRMLAKTANTYSVDLPGFGGTPKPDRQLSVADYAAFLLAVLDRAGVDGASVGPCILVGHSMGVQFAVEAARQQPDRCRGLVLMGPVVNPRRRKALLQALDLTRDCLFHESVSCNAVVLGDYVRCGPRWYLKELPVMMGYRLEDHITEVSVPVLVMRGGRDPIASREWCSMLAARAVAGEVREIEGCGHVIQHIATERTGGVIREFAGSLDTSLEAPG